MFRVLAGAVGFVSFFFLALLFERNYTALEDRIKAKTPIPVVQQPTGPNRAHS